MTLECERIEVELGGRPILRGLSCSLPERGVVGIVGPNGSGKSTLLDVLSGFLSIAAGTISAAPREDHLSREALSRPALARRFARLHQATVLPDELDVSEYLAAADDPDACRWMFGRASPRPAAGSEKAADLLDAAGVRPQARLGELSGGQRRVVALAASMLAHKPHLLLDEPLAGLAKGSYETAAKRISDASNSRLIVVVDHDLLAIQRLAEQVLVLREGVAVARYERGSYSIAQLQSHFG